MPHLHTQPGQHDLTVGAYIIKVENKQPKVLLHMHKKLNRLLPIGGHVEEHETPWEAIAHELEEESGYLLKQLKILQPKTRIESLTGAVLHPYPLSLNTHDLPGAHFHTDIQYGFVTEVDPELSIQDGESIDLRWLTLEELIALPKEMVFENTKEIYTFLVNEVLPSWEALDTKTFVLKYPNELIGDEF